MSDDAVRASGSRGKWTNRVTAPWMLISGGVLVLAFLVLSALFTGVWPSLLALLVVAAALLSVGAVEVSVNSREVAVRSLVLPPLRRRIPLTRVVGASAGEARPMQLGGWGYRWLPGRTSVSLRAGDALWLRLVNGREFVVTVDDAAGAARVVNAHLRGD